MANGASVECDVDKTYYPHLLLIPAVSFSILLFSPICLFHICIYINAF